MRLLASDAPDLPLRLRTMEASIDWSYDLLTPVIKRYFNRLSVFTGGFGIEMAVAFATGRGAGVGYPWSGIYGIEYPPKLWWEFDPSVERLDPIYRQLDQELPLAPLDLDPIDGLRALVNQSLIRLGPGTDGKPRYTMLETLRAFGLERLQQSGEEEAVRHAHAALMCGFADVSSMGLWTKYLRQWELERVDDELGNIRSALAWTIAKGPPAAELTQRMAAGFRLIWQMRGLIPEGVNWLERSLEDGRGPIWTRADALVSLAAECWVQGNDERALDCLCEAETMTASVGMKNLQGQAIYYQSLIAWRRREWTRMQELTERAFLIFGDWQDIGGVGVCHLSFGILERVKGDLVVAQQHFEDARALHDLLAFEWGSATGRYYGAEIARDLGNSREAAWLYRDALRYYWRLGDCWGAGASIGGIAVLAAAKGRFQIAATLFGAAESLCERVGALLPPTEIKAYDRVSAEVRARLGAPLYSLAFGEGRSVGPSECVQYGLAATAGLLGETVEEPWAGEANEATRARAVLDGLTDKRREILRLVVQGREIKEIAHAIRRDYNTVDAQLKAIQKHFGVNSRTDLIVLIYRNGLADLI